MRSAPPISVVVTCFNLEHYIGEAIESVLSQRDAPPFELIVVDDCSTDGSAEIIHGYGKAKYVRTETNGGVLLAMLAGVEQAQGDLVCLLDGDDVWEPTKLATTSATFEADPNVALVTHDLTFIDESGRGIDRRSRPSEELSPLAPGDAGERVRRGILGIDDYVWLGSALAFRRGLARFDEFDDFARQLPDPHNCYQDWPLAYWIAALSDVTIRYVGDPLFRYRLHSRNYSGDARTAERALRNFTRTRNTLAAMASIAELRRLPPSIRKCVDQRLMLASAEVDLYSGRRLRAVAGFARALAEVVRQGALVKRSLRFGGGVIFGPKVLTWLARKAR